MMKRKNPNENKPKKFFKNSKLKETAVCTSQYIGSQRLTKRLGIFKHGKISDSVSRMEAEVPDEIKARAQQDLHQILNITKGINGRIKHMKTDESRVSPVRNHAYHNTVDISSSDDEYVEIVDDVQTVVPPSSDKNSVFSAMCMSNKKVPSIDIVGFQQMKDFLVKKLDPKIRAVNRCNFSHPPMKDRLKSELMTLRKQFQGKQSTDSNGAASGDSGIHINPQFAEKSPFLNGKKDDSFELDLCPELTQKQERSNVKLFPDFVDFLKRADEMSMRPLPVVLPDDCSKYLNSDLSLSSFCTELDKTLNLRPHRIIPAQFPCDSPPTPKLFYRQKLF